MVAWYVRRISQGKMALDDVPSLWHDAVAAKIPESK